MKIFNNCRTSENSSNRIWYLNWLDTTIISCNSWPFICANESTFLFVFIHHSFFPSYPLFILFLPFFSFLNCFFFYLLFIVVCSFFGFSFLCSLLSLHPLPVLFLPLPFLLLIYLVLMNRLFYEQLLGQDLVISG